nr:MAG TPA: hypothetical protein [Caudoviricetes sp.]
MTPEQLKEGNRLQEEIEQLEELRKYNRKMCKFGWFVRTTKEIIFFRRNVFKENNGLIDIWDSDYKFIPESIAKRFLEIIDDEIEARKIMLADLGEE